MCSGSFDDGDDVRPNLAVFFLHMRNSKSVKGSKVSDRLEGCG